MSFLTAHVFLRPTPHPPSPDISDMVAISLVLMLVISSIIALGIRIRIANRSVREANDAFERAAGGPPRSPPPAPPVLGPNATPWQRRLVAAKFAPGVHSANFWDVPMDARTALLKDLFLRVATELGSGQIHEPAESIGFNLELRGVYASAPYRLVLMGGEGIIAEMRCAVRVGPFQVDRDNAAFPLKDLPVPRDPNDPWDKSDEVEEHRVFLAKGICIQGKEAFEERLAAWHRMPEAARATILAEMDRLAMYEVAATEDCVRVFLQGIVPRDESMDPAPLILEAVKFVVFLRDAVAQGTPAPAGIASGPVARAVCKFCRVVFVQTVDKPACPSCGALPTA